MVPSERLSMFKSNRQNSAKYNSSGSSGSTDNKIEGEKQKQKKRLSFKDPEVEKPPQENAFPQTSDFLKPRIGTSFPSPRRTPSPEDLTLEDRCFPSAKGADEASARRPKDLQKLSPYQRSVDQSLSNKDCSAERETALVEPSLDDLQPVPAVGQSSKQLPSKSEEREYLEELTPPPKLGPVAMKCPIIEFAGEERTSSPKNVGANVESMPTSARHQIQLLYYQLEQQRQQTQTAMYQIQLLKDQLEAESTARYKAQVHNHQLMMQNKDLVDHIQKLFQQVQDLEKKVEKLEGSMQAQEARQAPGVQAAFGPSQPPYRRNSASTQSLWSNPTLLSPAYNTMTRRGSATTIQQPQEPKETAAAAAAAAKPGQGNEQGRRVSIKDDPLSRYSSPFDTDWRYRRRGSYTNYATLDPSRSRNSDQNSGDGYSPSILDTEKSPTLPLFIPDQKQTTSMHRRSESVSSLEKTNRKTCIVDDTLVIADPPSNDYAAAAAGTSRASALSGQASASTSNLFSPSKRSNFGGKESENQKRQMQPFEPLRLFNS